jgi:autotransporter-associated beta strand protein
MADGGTVSVAGGAGIAIVAEPAGSTGTLNIGAALGHTAVAPGFLSAAMVQFGLGNGALNFNHTATNYAFAPLITGNGSVNVFSGTTILSGNNAYTGATRVNGGALIVNGSIASSALTTVNGGLLGGVGTVGNTQINAGGTFAPGPQNAPGSMTVAGNLAFQPGALYLVQFGATASIANVTGTAALAGNVLANFAPGSYITRQYDPARKWRPWRNNVRWHYQQPEFRRQSEL